MFTNVCTRKGPAICTLLLALTFLGLLVHLFIQQQNQIQRGEVFVLAGQQSPFVIGKTWIDKGKRIVSNDSPPFPTILEREKGHITTARLLHVCVGAFAIYEIPANQSEIAIYRTYFPAM